MTYLSSNGETSKRMEEAMNLGGLGKLKTAMAYRALRYLDKVEEIDEVMENVTPDFVDPSADPPPPLKKDYELRSVNR